MGGEAWLDAPSGIRAQFRAAPPDLDTRGFWIHDPGMRRAAVTPAVNAVTVELRQGILTGTLRPGQKLRQEDLAAQLGVSRMPVRQALAVLEREGLVDTHRSRVATVRPLRADYIRDIYKFREVLERYVAETLAARRADMSRGREILATARAVVANHDTAQAIDLDVAFHTHLYDAVGNHVVSEVMRNQWTHIRRVMFMGLFVGLSGFRSSVWDEHAAILDAIEAGDADRAGAVAASHMLSASAVALQNIDLLAADNAVSLLESDDAQAEPIESSKVVSGGGSGGSLKG